MEKQESTVTQAVRETVIKTAEKLDNLREKSKPFAEEIKEDLAGAGKEAAKLSDRAVSTAVDTAKAALRGFKEGMEEVRKKKKTGKKS